MPHEKLAALLVKRRLRLDLVVDGRDGHGLQRAIHGQQRAGADGHAGGQCGDDRVQGTHAAEQEPERRSQKGGGHDLRALLRREVAHVVRVDEAIANASARGAARQARDDLAQIGDAAVEKEVVRREERQHLQPRGHLQQAGGEQPPAARVRVEAAAHQTTRKQRRRALRGEGHAAQLPDAVLEHPVDGSGHGRCAGTHARGDATIRGEGSGLQKGLRAEDARRGAEDHGDGSPECVGEVIAAGGGGVVLGVSRRRSVYPWEKHVSAGGLEKGSNTPERKARCGERGLL